MTPTISCSIITLNPGEFFRYCLHSVYGHVDQIVVVDSGSTDNTKKICEDYGAKYVLCTHDTHPDWFLWDEDTSQWFMGREDFIRELSFTESDCDYRLWIDADDQVIGSDQLRWVVQQLQEGDYVAAWMYYDYARFKDSMKVGLTLERERIIKKGISKWQYAAHSTHGVQNEYPAERQRFFPQVRIDHCHGDAAQLAGKPGKTPKCRGYKALWAYHVAMNGDSPVRDLFYLGRESIGFSPDIAFQWFKEVLKHPDANIVQLAMSHFNMAKIHEMRGDLDKAYKSFITAASFKQKQGDYAEARYCAARIAYKLGHKNAAKRQLKHVIEHAHDRAVIPCDPSITKQAVHVYKALQNP